MSADPIDAAAAARRPSCHRSGTALSARVIGAAVGALVIASSLPLAVSANELPSRKAGLWEQRMTSQDAGATPTVIQQCTDAVAEQAFQAMAVGLGQRACTKNEVRREGARWVTESICSMGNIRINSKGVITGSFDSAYRMEVESRFEPALMGKSEDKTVVEAKWLGSCKADQRPGDMIMSDGKKMNILQLQKPGR